ncbi:MAG: hypothetical protein EXR73_01900 [Myxococcales bacterium]|nr:hypothetical protein [Myxococcales bacterium]
MRSLSSSSRLAAVCLLACLTFIAACGPGALPNGNGTRIDSGTPLPPCIVDGVTRCDGKTLLVCRGGAWTEQQVCAMECDAARGCVSCLPGSGVCNSAGESQRCLPDGSGFEIEACDSVQGSMCDFKAGVCTGPCSRNSLGTSYIGCEYFPTVTGNTVLDTFQFAVAISNTSSTPAQVTIEDGALGAPITVNVAPGDVSVQRLPWVAALKACVGGGGTECGSPQNTGALAVRGAYHLRSTQPVTVYQFNPLDYTDGGFSFSYTNDAALLLPTNVWTGNYVGAAYQAWSFVSPAWPSQLTITAAEDGTTVGVNARAAAPGGLGSPAFNVGVPQSVMLNKGDALQILSTSGDLTGSVVQANKRVQVIGGHYCTQMPHGFFACDHIEETMFPIETLSTRYIVSMPAVPSNPQGREQVVRIIATQGDTTLVYDPPQSLPTNLSATGSFIDAPHLTGDFHITANHKILVVQYMESQEAPGSGGTGDPAMTLAVATDQYRQSYLFHAPTNYETNYVNVTAPTGATVMLDGAPLGGFSPVGGSGFGVVRVQLGPGMNGNHTMSGDAPFGISVYGYGQYTSYWYPGGLDLATVPIE